MTVSGFALDIRPAMPSPLPVDWPGAIWVGEVDVADLPATGAAGGPDDARWATLTQAEEHPRARLLVRDGLRVRGFVTVPVEDSRLDLLEVAEAVAALPPGADCPEPAHHPRISVVICTRDRVDLLTVALESVLALDYADLEVVVVDNASRTRAVAEHVAGLGDPRVIVVEEPTPGLARARNTGVRHASGEIVAFTDDDVMVDSRWLRGIVVGFARAESVSCVSGLVPSGELRTPTQVWFDRRVTWADALQPTVFSTRRPPPDMPLFPFQVGAYGTGANFAVDRATLIALGGFDEALGVGTPTGGGEDIDLFSRVLLAGHTLVVEPSAVIWHRHRADEEALRVQARGYGLGLGAWMTKVLTGRGTAALALRRSVSATARLARLGRGAGLSAAGPENADSLEGALPRRLTSSLGRLELASAARGPVRYWAARRSGAQRTPLAPQPPAPSELGRPSPHLPWADPGPLRTALLGLLAVLAAGVGAWAHGRPGTGWSGPALVLFWLLGPGAAAVSRWRLTASSAVAVVPAIGIAALSGLSGAMAILGWWHPVGALRGALVLVAVVGSASVWSGRVALIGLRNHPIGLDRRARRGAGRSRPEVRALWSAYALGTVVWLGSLPTASRAAVGDYGLVAAAPGLAIALGLVVIGFVLALRADRPAAMAVGTLLAVVVSRVTVPLITEVPIYPWTYKHLGVADYVARHGGLAGDVDIYNQWPGLFTGTAWLTTTSGLDPLQLALWFAPAIHLLVVLGVYELARAYGMTARVAWCAAFVAELVNWVGQDYYAPQSIAYVLAIVILGLLLRSVDDRAAAWCSIPLFAALVISHQLTPVWVAGIACVLGVTGHVRPRWIGALFAVMAGTYIAGHQDVVASYGLFSGFAPWANLQSNIPTIGVPGREFTSAVDRIPPVLLWLLAAGCAVRALATGRRFWVPLVLGFSSFGLVAGQSYGGEAVFRVFLYSIPGCALLVAPAVVDLVARRRDQRRGRVRAGATAATLVLVGLSSLQGYLGTWSVAHVSPRAVAQATALYEVIPPPALIFTVSTGLPERPTADYVAYASVYAAFDRPLVPEHGMQGLTFTHPADLAVVEDVVGEQSLPTYLVIADPMKTYSVYYGLYQPGAIDRLVGQLDRSAHWQRLSPAQLPGVDEDIVIFRRSTP